MRIIIQAFKSQINGKYEPNSQIELNSTQEVEIVNEVNYRVTQIEDIIRVYLNENVEDVKTQT